MQARAEGNPFYIRELFRTFGEHDILQSGDAGWVLGDLRPMRVPALVRLGGDTRELLSVAAVVGQEVTLDVWQRASDATDGQLEVAIEQALEARLIEESVSGSGLRFSHALIREALYEGTILTRRRVTHRRVAEAMEHLPQPDPDAVAHHYQQAGDARAADWLVRAGERAQRSYALLAALPRRPGGPRRRRRAGPRLPRGGRADRDRNTRPGPCSLCAERSWACPSRAPRLPLLLLEGEWAKARQVAEDLTPLPSVAQRYHQYVLGTLSRYQGRPREAWASVHAALPKGLASEPGDSLFHEAMDTIRLAAEEVRPLLRPDHSRKGA